MGIFREQKNTFLPFMGLLFHISSRSLKTIFQHRACQYKLYTEI